ncbi:MAG: outer membrane beta-barrel domain-containing protein [Bdellovibrionales bacterium]
MNLSLQLIILGSLLGASLTVQANTAKARRAPPVQVAEDVDTLGGNEELMRKAKNLRSQVRTRIVQERIVDRRNRLEFGVSYGGIVGGDSYLRTQSTGFAAHYHLTPRWSLGIQFSDFTNELTPEGKRVFDLYRRTKQAGGTPAFGVDVDYPLDSTVALLNWYPIYGKTSFLDMGVTQFDLYLIAGVGSIRLSSGSAPLYQAGLGVGAWLSQHLSLRAEVKYQNYEDRPITGRRELNIGSATVGLGWIL